MFRNIVNAGNTRYIASIRNLRLVWGLVGFVVMCATAGVGVAAARTGNAGNAAQGQQSPATADNAAGNSAAGNSAPVAPVPVAILNAKRVFISNAGADSGLFPHPFSGRPDRGYNEFYADMQAWGRYQVVADPGAADLVLELQLLAPAGPSSPNKANGAADPLPMFRLVVYERQTHFVLWAVTESIEVAFVQKTHDRNFDEALERVMDDLKGVVGRAGLAKPN